MSSSSEINAVRFKDRRDAGQQLAQRLVHLGKEDPLVLGLPRGGVPVAAEIASALAAPLDVLVVRKLGCPWQPELGIGAVGEGNARVLNGQLISRLGLGEQQIEEVSEIERAEVERRVRRYRGDRQLPAIEGRTVIVVDDGLATGSTAKAAIEILREMGARRVILAVPVAPSETAHKMAEIADEVVVLQTPYGFIAIGQWYDDFTQVTDEEIDGTLR